MHEIKNKWLKCPAKHEFLSHFHFIIWDLHSALNLCHIQLICSRRLLKHLGKIMENLRKWKFIYWIHLKTLWLKEKLLMMSNFSFCNIVFKSYLQQMCKSVGSRKGLNTLKHSTFIKTSTWRKTHKLKLMSFNTNSPTQNAHILLL